MDEPVKENRVGMRLADVACVVFFLACLGLWLPLIPMLSKSAELLRAGEADGLGMGLWAVFLIATSGLALVIAFVLSLLAARLPLFFRIISLLPALMGIIAGALIFIGNKGQGR